MVLELDIVPIRNTSVAGESISFMCIVTKIISGLEHQPLAVWVENGTELTEQGESNATLTFDKLNTSNGKVYTCQGNLSSRALYTPLIVMENYTLAVESKLYLIMLCIDNNIFTCSSHTKHKCHLIKEYCILCWNKLVSDL